jgi:hypothetical protein
MKKCSVYAIANDEATADKIVDRLKSSGFSKNDVSVLYPDRTATGAKTFSEKEKHSKAPEGATIGAGSGAVIGGTLGWLAGIGALAIPGIGPFIAAGPIMGALSGMAVGGTVGGITGGLVGLGVPEYEAKLYEGRVREGAVLVAVHSDNAAEVVRARDVLTECRATEIRTTGLVG